MMLHINGNLATLADFGLLQAARPVLYRQREILRKRHSRLKARQESKLTLVFSNGQTVKPIPSNGGSR